MPWQSNDDGVLKKQEIKVVTKRVPTEDELNDLLFARKVAKFVKSNAIVFAKDDQTIGIGAGQMSRVISTEIAALKADQENLDAKNSAMASDAFFPFRDGIDQAAKVGITSIIQPGLNNGSNTYLCCLINSISKWKKGIRCHC